MGTEDTNSALRHANVKLVAVCDLYKGRLESAKQKWGANLFVTQDYQEVLKRKDIDAVIIATPDSLAQADQHRCHECGEACLL
jgi:predicted dehydrogenase